MLKLTMSMLLVYEPRSQYINQSIEKTASANVINFSPFQNYVRTHGGKGVGLRYSHLLSV